MVFSMSSSCKAALQMVALLVPILAMLLTAAVYGVDARVTAIVAPLVEPVKQDVASLTVDVAVVKSEAIRTREDIARVERGQQAGFAALEAQIGWLAGQRPR